MFLSTSLKLTMFLSTLFFFQLFSFGQLNLVPNPSFEYYDSCPQPIAPNYQGVDKICRAVPWFSPAQPEPFNCGGSSTDFFHACNGSVPRNINGFQYARTGLGYGGAGVATNPSGSNGREYLQVQLIESLKKKKYCISFYVVTEDINFSSTNCIQARFTTDSVFQHNYDRIILNDGIGATEILRDTLNWMLIKGIYTAGGGEKFMTVGCFDLITWDDFICSETIGCDYAAYYFDDFGVYELPEISAGFGGEIDTLGENVPLQASCEGCWNDLVYRWWPSAGLSDTTILNPIASPEVTTTYYFGLIDTSETVPCIVDLVDSVTVFVTIPQDTVTPPPTFFSWLVYPTPTGGNLTLQFSALTNDSQLLIIDARGRLVRKIFVPKNTESFPLDISALAAGEYFLQVENESLKEKRKVVKF
jgi:hypothetical protein